MRLSTECFKIQLLKTKENNILDMDSYEPIYQIFNEKDKFFSEPTMIVADPFLFEHNGNLYMFFESKKLYHDGVIMMTCTSDLETWSRPVQVLKENFHLSFPNVFEDNGHIYMIPETCQSREIRLYEATNDQLTEFRLKKVLLKDDISNTKDMSFSDTISYKDEDGYFLVTTIEHNNQNQLLLYWAENLLGPYQQHVNSPIITSLKYGRNAGSIFRHEGVLLRPAQDCVDGYGENVHLMKINTISKDSYNEEPYKENIINRKDTFYVDGGHQFHFVDFKGYTVLATDAKEYRLYLKNRIKRKLGIIGEKNEGKITSSK